MTLRTAKLIINFRNKLKGELKKDFLAILDSLEADEGITCTEDKCICGAESIKL